MTNYFGIFEDLMFEPEELLALPAVQACEQVMQVLVDWPDEGIAYVYAVRLMDMEGGIIFCMQRQRGILPGEAQVWIAAKRLRQSIEAASCEESRFRVG